ncbi:MAG: biopolymer transporter ExbD [Bdellovibrio sp.]
MFYRKAPRREIIVLNLVALIDISALIIIFFIMGAVFGETSVEIPENLKLPFSDNKEGAEVAPSLILQSDHVKVQFLGTKVPLSQFQGNLRPSLDHEKAVKAYISQVPPLVRRSGLLLNLVADRETPYQVIFDVLRFYREMGFQSVLFVAQGK